jgi:hypothetical protein
MTTDEVTFKICDSQSPISLHGQDDFTYVVMPMRYEDTSAPVTPATSRSPVNSAEPDEITDARVE